MLWDGFQHNTTEIAEDYGTAMYVCLVYLNAKDQSEKDSSIDSNIEHLCICKNKSALERDRSMWEGGHFLVSSCDGLVLVAPIPAQAHLIMKPFCCWNFITFKFISYQSFKLANQQTCKLTNTLNIQVLNSMPRPSHSTDQHIYFRSSGLQSFFQSGLICNLLSFYTTTNALVF